jgi:hypothetical protein
MASNLDPERVRKVVRWWDILPARRRSLEGRSLVHDRTVYRLTPVQIEANRDLRAIVDYLGVAPEDLLVYGTHAEGPFGRYRLAAVFLAPPERVQPMVLCLDGPRGKGASEHRNNEVWLCLYYENDPDERRWKPKDELLRLFDLARLHIFGEYRWRETGSWPVEEAPHGTCVPAPPDPSLALEPLESPGRNDPCPCGSGLKAKRCCGG